MNFRFVSTFLGFLFPFFLVLLLPLIFLSFSIKFNSLFIQKRMHETWLCETNTFSFFALIFLFIFLFIYLSRTEYKLCKFSGNIKSSHHRWINFLTFIGEQATGSGKYEKWNQCNGRMIISFFMGFHSAFPVLLGCRLFFRVFLVPLFLNLLMIRPWNEQEKHKLEFVHCWRHTYTHTYFFLSARSFKFHSSRRKKWKSFNEVISRISLLKLIEFICSDKWWFRYTRQLYTIFGLFIFECFNPVQCKTLKSPNKNIWRMAKWNRIDAKRIRNNEKKNLQPKQK